MGIYILYAILVVASVVDFKTLKIPNALTLFGVISGLTVSYFDNGFEGLFHSFIAVLLTFGVLFPIWALSAVGMPVIGAGDVKLYMVIASYILFSSTMSVVYFSFIFGAVIFIFLIPPKKILSMFKNLFYLTFYCIPNIKEKNLKKVSFSFPIFLSFLFVTHFFS